MATTGRSHVTALRELLSSVGLGIAAVAIVAGACGFGVAGVAGLLLALMFLPWYAPVGLGVGLIAWATRTHGCLTMLGAGLGVVVAAGAWLALGGLGLFPPMAPDIARYGIVLVIVLIGIGAGGAVAVLLARLYRWASNGS